MHDPGRNTCSVDLSWRCRQFEPTAAIATISCPLEDRLALVVGEASGKGLAAALVIARVQSSLWTVATFARNNLAALFKIVNLQAYTSSLADC